MTALPTVGVEGFEQEVVASELPVLVDFWAAWCAPCVALTPVLEQLAEEYAGQIKILKVDADNEADLCTKFNVRGLPTMLLFEGGENENVSNFRSKSQLKKIFDGRLAGQGADDILEASIADPEMRREYIASTDLDQLRKTLAGRPEIVRDPFPEGDTPLSEVIARGDEERVALILEYDPPLSLGNMAALGHEDRLRSALEADDELIDQVEGKSGVPLLQAICYKQWGSMQILLDAGAPVANGSTPDSKFLVNVLLTANVPALRQLVETGLDVRKVMEGGHTAVHLAVFYSNDVEVVEFLVGEGVPIDLRTDDGKTALDYIAERADSIPDPEVRKAKLAIVEFLEKTQNELERE